MTSQAVLDHLDVNMGRLYFEHLLFNWFEEITPKLKLQQQLILK